MQEKVWNLSREETEGWRKPDTMDSALLFAFFIYRWIGHKACLEKMRRPTKLKLKKIKLKGRLHLRDFNKNENVIMQ